MQLLLYVGLAVLGTAVCWKGSGLLEKASERLAMYYQLPVIVQGAVIAAVGSSFPELSSTVIATLLHGSFDLGVSAIVGSAIFNILVIPGISGLVGQQLTSARMLVYKDAQFYITSVAVTLLIFALAVIYNPVPGSELVGEMTRPLAIVPVLLYGLYLFLQQQDMSEYEPDHEVPDTIKVGREWGRLLISLVVIIGGVEALVQSALGLGEWFGTPPFLWGLTVIAAGTSLPDAFVSVRAAQRGEGTMSMANVLGSNIFDLLIAVPVGILIAGAAPVDFTVAVPMMGYLTLVSIVLFAMLRTRLSLTRFEAWVLLVLYGVFVGWMVLETMGVTSVVVG
ncbi:sodium:calcium antiporter [Salisaeta longa]|uniref:sodium:calcium antiporter n=1 Tax=Salisaeta longa TaxID=503170 RepID=UPI0003B6F90D|nr:sodium:calcium antiporter [Salisaeta longa]